MDTSFFSHLNWLHVLVAAVAYFALGSVWYTVLFGKKWIAHQKIVITDESSRDGMGAVMGLSFVFMFISTIALAILVDRLGLTAALSGAKLGLLTGAGFSAAAISVSYVYVKKPAGLHLIDGLYHVIGQVIAAIILCVWH